MLGEDRKNYSHFAERGNMSNILSVFITLATLAVVVWAVVDVARRPAVLLAGKWKALWIAGMVGA